MALIAGLVALVVVAAFSNWLWFVSIRFAAERHRSTAPTGGSYDIFVNRDGVAIYGNATAILRLDASLTVVSALLRHRRGQPWKWAVTVRDSGIWRDTALAREVFRDRPTAQARAAEIARSVESGTAPWL